MEDGRKDRNKIAEIFDTFKKNPTIVVRMVCSNKQWLRYGGIKE